MKKLLILIIAIILALFAYSEYKDYQRFNPKNANLTSSKTIDVNYHNQETVYNYYNALEQANSYMQMQWSANGIDVKSPEKSNASEEIAVKKYAEKLAKISFYQTILENSKELKKQGLNNDEIKFLEEQGITLEAYKLKNKTFSFHENIINLMPKKALYSGEKSPFVFELQKLLVKNGFNIPVDGVYKNITSEALKTFEENNNFLPDGKIDLLTLKMLLKKSK